MGKTDEPVATKRREGLGHVIAGATVWLGGCVWLALAPASMPLPMIPMALGPGLIGMGAVIRVAGKPIREVSILGQLVAVPLVLGLIFVGVIVGLQLSILLSGS